jgi:septal ring factor EnvC (AmiA/AmiB activator)
MTRIARWMAPALVALLLLGTFSVAAAAEGTPTKPPQTANAELEKQYALRKQQVRSLDEMLKRDERRSAEVARILARAKAEGKNTASLEQVLVTYRAKLVAARSFWQAAAAMMKSHAGFSNAGKVTNLDQARATLKAAGSTLEQSYRAAQSAEELLNKALAALRSQK